MAFRRQIRSLLLPVFVFLYTFLLGILAAYAAEPAATLSASAFRSFASGADSICFERSDSLPSGTALDELGCGGIIGTREGSCCRIVSSGTIHAPVSCCQLFAGFSCSSVSFGNFDTSETEDMTLMFHNCSRLTSLDLSGFDTGRVRSLMAAFQLCTSLREIRGLSCWNTSSLTNMKGIFNHCEALSSLDLTGWNTAGVTDLSLAFQSCLALREITGISGWNTASVTDLSYLFYGCGNLPHVDVSGWNTSRVTSMASVFNGLGLTAPEETVTISGLENWDLGSCTTIARIFMNGENFTASGKLDNASLAGIAGWNVSHVTDMSSVFYGQGRNLTALDLSSWDVSSVTGMNHMFADCNRLERLDLSRWNVGKLETVCNMFDDCFALKTAGDLSHWNTESLIDISGFLNGCTSFEGENGVLDLSGWNTSGIKGAQEVFRGIRVNTINLNGWNLSGVNGEAWNGAGQTDGIHYAYTPGCSSVEEMFLDCADLTSVITDSSWSLASGVSSRNMFSGCSHLAASEIARLSGGGLS